MSSPEIHVPKNKFIKPEDITINDLHHLSKNEFALWALTSGVKVDSNDVDFNDHRYLLPIYMDNSYEIVWQKAAQLGATVYMILRILWWLESHQGRKAGLYFPTKEGVENLSKDRLTPLINSCPSIANMADAGDKLGLRKVGSSSFYLYHLGGVASKDSVPLDYIAFDEVRLCSAQDIDQALERVSHSPYKYKVFMSTAGLPDCFSGDTTVIVREKNTKKITKKPISSLIGCYEDYQILSYNRLGGYRPIWRNINNVVNRGPKRMYKTKLAGGYEVLSTSNHKFATFGDNLPVFGKSVFKPIVDIPTSKPSQKEPKTGVLALNEIHSHRLKEKAPKLGGLGVRSCEDTGLWMDAYDIDVEQDSWFFLAESGALVHNSDINARFNDGTQYVWMSRCGCPDGVDLARTFPDCVIEDPKRGLYLRCPKCKYIIKNPQNGRYVAHNPGASYHSYHVSQLVSRFISLEEIWNMWKRTTNLEEFYKAKLGLPYIDEANRGVTKEQCEAAINEDHSWGSDKKKNHCAMGVDQGAGYCMAIIADMYEDKKRIRHVEIIEQNNPDYMENGKVVTPFKRLRELMKEFNVRLCVVDAMPNVNDAISFAQDFPGRVFLAHYSKDAKETVQWMDKAKHKPTVVKAGPLLKFKYSCVLGRFPAISVALGAWQQGDVILPHPDRLRQMCTNEKTGQIQPESPARRMIAHLCRLIKRFRVTNEETGEGKHEWIYSGGDPHLAHAWTYCNMALERLRRTVIFTFA